MTMRESTTGDGPRCDWAIHYGIVLRTRCALPAGHRGPHEGHGLREFPDQRVQWQAGNTREYRTERTDMWTWEEP